MNAINEAIQVLLYWRVYLCAGLFGVGGLILHERFEIDAWIAVVVGVGGVVLGAVWQWKRGASSDFEAPVG